jgi:hypothetical protein
VLKAERDVPSTVAIVILGLLLGGIERGGLYGCNQFYSSHI